jgi:hypothetical protein
MFRTKILGCGSCSFEIGSARSECAHESCEGIFRGIVIGSESFGAQCCVMRRGFYTQPVHTQSIYIDAWSDLFQTEFMVRWWAFEITSARSRRAHAYLHDMISRMRNYKWGIQSVVLYREKRTFKQRLRTDDSQSYESWNKSFNSITYIQMDRVFDSRFRGGGAHIVVSCICFWEVAIGSECRG